MRALIEPNGRVADVHETGFPVHPALRWVDVPAGVPVERGWRHDNGAFHPAPPQAGTGGDGGSAYGGDLNIGGEGGSGGWRGGRGGNASEGRVNIGGQGGASPKFGGAGGSAGAKRTKSDIINIKPSIWGIGFDLRALWRRWTGHS